MRFSRLVLPALALVTISVWLVALYPKLTAGRPGSKAQSSAHPRRSGSPVGLREVDFPHYSLRAGFDSQSTSMCLDN